MGTREGAREENLLNAIHAAGEKAKPHGCICPVGAEATCQGLACPRLPPARQEYRNGNLVWVR